MSKFPSYSDLGKDCIDLFSKGYHIGLFKINVKNETCHGLQIKTSGVHKMEDKSATADVEVKMPLPIKGASGTTKWDIENNIAESITVQNIIPGADVTVVARLNPDSGNVGGELKAQYQHPRLTLNANGGLDGDSVVVGGSLVSGYGGLLGAYKVNFDTSKNEMTANNIGLSFNALNYNLLIAYDNLSVLNGFYFHRVSPNVEIGAQSKILGGEDGTQLAIGGRYTFSGYGHALRGKVDSKSILGLGIELKIQQGFSVFGSADVDLKNVSAGGHKIGFGLEFGQ